MEGDKAVNGRAQPFRSEGAEATREMQYAWYDFAGNIGVALMVIGYLLLQAEKIRSSDLRYSLMNGIGALLVVVSLIYRFNLSAFLVEAFWLLISIYGLIKFAVRPRAKESH
jgi:predicted membrane protein